VTTPITITPAKDEDFDGIWEIFRQIVAGGDTYIYNAHTTREEARHIWMECTHPYVAKHGDKIVGTYVIRDNKIGRGAHVCNAGFMVHPQHQGQKIGRMMGEHALTEAKMLGYKSMQFNVVVSTNHRSINLWKSLGFTIIGTIPEGFDHKDKGLVDIHIMHRVL